MNQSHIVESGNTLSQIAADNDMSLGALLELNPEFRSNPDLIHPGDVVRLAPAARHRAASGAHPQAANMNPGGAAAPPDPGGALARIAGTQGATGGDGVTPAQLRQIAPYTDLSQARWTELADALNQSMALANANTPERQAMFLAQMAHETAGFRTLEEYASGDAYEGRTDLGNTQPGDGRRFKGRGFIQLTGRHNYTQASQALGIDLVSNPELAERPDIAARTAAWYWNNRNLNSYVDRGDFVGLTRAINGGTNGLADRQAYLGRARAALGGGVDLPDPGPTPNPNPNPNPGGSNGGTYTVRSGDTLSGIASRYGTDWQTLARINNISNPNRIYPGQRIRLPGGGNEPPGGSSGGTYIVRSGDTLSGIASRHGTDWQTLARLNNISNPNLIYPGQRLQLPGGSNGAPGGSSGGTYTVRSGDTLSGIASRHGTNWQTLAQLNNISNPNRIYPGQRIRLPGGSNGTPGGSSGGTYTVRSGDTLSGIASRHGTNWQTLARINDISNPNLIYPGQRLQLPGRGNGSPGGSSGGTYTVRSGDTLSGIASRYPGVSWQDIQRANGISNPNRIYPGQRLTIPGGGNGSPGGPTPPAPGGNGTTYSPWTVYSTGHRPAFSVDHPDELQPHHDYQTRVRQGQTLEVRDVVLHRNGQSQTSQPVPSPVSGRVERVAYEPGGAGHYVVLRGDDGSLAYLFHFSHIDVQQGQRISYGQDLGNQGSTGNSTGPHIHIESSPAIIDRWVHDLLDGRFDGRRT